MAKQRFDGVADSLRTYWLPQFRAGGVSGVVGAIFTPSVYVPEGALRHALWVLDGLLTEIEENGEAIEIARSAEELRRINGAGKIAVLVALEGAEPLGQDLAALRLLHRLGLRMVSLTHARRTLFADGNWENDTHGGLSRAGRAAIREMNRLGIVVDVSHGSDRTTRDVLETSVKPVIASHSNARAVQDHLRNVTDERSGRSPRRAGWSAWWRSRRSCQRPCHDRPLGRPRRACRRGRRDRARRHRHRFLPLRLGTRRGAGHRGIRCGPETGVRPLRISRHGEPRRSARTHRGAPPAGVFRCGAAKHLSRQLAARVGGGRGRCAPLTPRRSHGCTRDLRTHRIKEDTPCSNC